MNKKMAVLVFGLMFMMAGAGVASDDEMCNDMGGEKKGKMFEKMSKELNLTEAQEKEIKAFREQQKGEMKAAFEQMKAKRQMLKEELAKPQVDNSKIEQIKTELKNIHAKQVDGQVAHTLKMKEILTPEQFQKFTQLAEKRQEKMMKKEKGKGHHMK